MPAPKLKLRARDEDDLTVIASCLQDAIVPLSDLAYLPDEQRFAFVANRFRWEGKEVDKDRAPYERINCGVSFDRVTGVRSRGVDISEKHGMLSVLTLKPEEGSVLLVCAGGAAIRLAVEAIDCRLEDLGEAWPTRWRPRHSDADAG